MSPVSHRCLQKPCSLAEVPQQPNQHLLQRFKASRAGQGGRNSICLGKTHGMVFTVQPPLHKRKLLCVYQCMCRVWHPSIHVSVMWEPEACGGHTLRLDLLKPVVSEGNLQKWTQFAWWQFVVPNRFRFCLSSMCGGDLHNHPPAVMESICRRDCDQSRLKAPRTLELLSGTHRMLRGLKHVVQPPQ